MARLYTVIFPFGEDTGDSRQVLLGLKKRGMGEGLWNGFGGKLESGETLDECAHRELQEECGLQARRMEYVGVLTMVCKSGWEITILVYTARELVGSVTESEEMQPKWFGIDELPYSDCHTEAPLWWPTMLDGSLFFAHFVFNLEALVEHRVERVSRERLDQLQREILAQHAQP
ncbi:hypothetical protein H4S02_010037 [Coemansia sp. RSA 2611]|nr:hypothetical protein H4S01_005978 [Coemansia sp. RSA 2610]KAJ2368822.1 hypothetical protein H4S02_010037 [Coemansia sp. RSA 2611]